MVAYYMRQPPALDDKMIRNCIRMLKWAPLFFLGNGYWMISNKQIFSNVYDFIDRHSDMMKSKHIFKLTADDPAAPMTLLFFLNITLLVIMVVANEWMKRVGFTLGQQDIEIDEDLPPFFKAVNLA